MNHNTRLIAALEQTRATLLDLEWGEPEEAAAGSELLATIDSALAR